jgi:hypothetical protein
VSDGWKFAPLVTVTGEHEDITRIMKSMEALK